MAKLLSTSITGSLVVSGSADLVTIQGSGSTASTSIFAIDGNNGRLFEVSDDLSDSLFSVNTVAGLPVLEVFADNRVVAGAFNQNDFVISGSRVGIGIAAPESTLHISGSSPKISIGKITGGSTNDGVYDEDHIIVGEGGSISIGAERRGDYTKNANQATGTTFRSRLNIWSDNENHITFGGANTHMVTAWEEFKIWINNDSGDAGTLHLYNKSTKTEFARFTGGTGAGWYNGGDFGFGTTSPTQKLTVEGNISASGAIVATSFTGSLFGLATSASYAIRAGSVDFANSATTATSASYASNAELLDGINGASFLRSDATDTATGVLTFTGNGAGFPLNISNANSSYTAIAIKNTGTGNSGIYYDAIDGDLAGSDYGFIGQNNAGHMEYNIGASSPAPFHYFSGGSVGIGNAKPAATLTVEGAISSSGDFYVGKDGSTGTLHFGRTAGTVAKITGDAEMSLYSDNLISFIESDGSTVKIAAGLNNGTFNINTTGEYNAAIKLFVNGATRFNGDSTVTGNLTVDGIVTAQEFHTEFVSASIIYQSGSTQFGNSNDDTHEFYGTVGINSSSPINPLEVVAPANEGKWRVQNYGGMYFGNNSDAGYERYIHGRSDGGLSIGRVSGSNLLGGINGYAGTNYDHVYIQPDGNVGIGTVSPSAKLQVVGDTRFGNSNSDLHQMTGSMLHFYNPSVSSDNVTTDLLKLEAYTGDFGANPGAIALAFKFQDSNNLTNEARIRMATVNDTDYGDNDEAASNLIFSTTNDGTESDKMIITGRGAIGIGTNNPGNYKLNIAGGNADQLLIENTTASGTANIAFKANSTRNAGPFIKSTARGATASDSDLQLGDETGTIMTLNGGNIGIGTTSPNSKLTIQGDVTADNINSDGKVQLQLNGATDTTKQLLLGFETENNFGFIQTLDYGVSWTAYNLALQHKGGNVGIGTTSPTGKLHVSGTNNVLLLEGSGSTIFDVQGSQGQLFSVTDSLVGSLFSVNDISGLPILEVFDTDKVVMGTFGQNTLVVTGSKVGVGTDAPTSNLHVNSAGGSGVVTQIKVTQEDDGAGHPGADAILRSSGWGEAFLILGGHQISAAGGDFNIESTSDLAFKSGGSNTRMFITNTGNVGIGTTAPNATLHVVGGAHFGTDSGVVNPRLGQVLIETGSGASTSFLMYTYGSSVFNILSDGSIAQIGWGSSTDRTVAFTNSGAGDIKVGIGTTSPNYKLDVEGSIGMNDYIYHNGDSDTYFGFNAADSFKIRLGNGDRTVMTTTSTTFNTDTTSTGYLQSYGLFYHRSNIVTLNKAANGWVTWATRDTTGAEAVIDFTNIGRFESAGNATIGGNLTVGGIVTAQEFHTEFVSASIVYQSGSTKFGDTTDDVHQFTGSVNISAAPNYGVRLAAGNALIGGGAAGGDTQLIYWGGDVAYYGRGSLGGTVDQHEFRTGGATRLTVSSSGYVGIGTTSPGAKLEINDTDKAINTKGNLFVSTTDALAIDKGGQISLGGVWSGTSQIQFAGIAGRKENATSGNAGGYLQFSTTVSSGGNLTEKMRITSAGNVGIGTTAPLADGLTIRREGGDRKVLLRLDRPNTPGLQTALQFTVSDIMVGQIQHEYVASNYNHMSFTLRSVGGGDIIPLWLENSGNVGIGTTSPAAKLDVNGSVRISNTGSDKKLEFLRTGGKTFSIEHDTSRLYFYNSTDSTAILALANNGNVGIGTTSPTQKLDVNGTLKATGSIFNAQTFDATNSTFNSTNTTINSTNIVVGNNTTDYVYVGGSTLNVYNSKVGIGTTTPSSSFHVIGESSFEGGSRNWNEALPGTSVGTIHIDPGSTTDHFGGAITFGASDSSNGRTAQAGIYTRTDGTYGTKMYFATTDNYGAGSATRMFIDYNGYVGIGTTSPTEKLDVNGNVRVNGVLEAVEKSFNIEHPTKPGKRLIYGVLEGPEHAVYVRGKATEKVIELPEVWTGLVHQDTITVQLTCKGKPFNIWVEDIRDNKVYINTDVEEFEFYYYVQAERKDVNKLIIEKDAN